MGRSRGLAAGDELGGRLEPRNLWLRFHFFQPGICSRREGVLSAFLCSLRDARALRYGDGVAGTWRFVNPSLPPPPPPGAVVGKECVFRHVFQKLAGCKEAGVFSCMCVRFTGLLEIL